MCITSGVSAARKSVACLHHTSPLQPDPSRGRKRHRVRMPYSVCCIGGIYIYIFLGGGGGGTESGPARGGCHTRSAVLEAFFWGGGGSESGPARGACSP